MQQSSCHSTTLSDELLEQIFSLVDDHVDLLAPSLASRHFSALVHPHIQYRVIRCNLATNDLWKALAEIPLLAHHVRVVEIQRQWIDTFSETEILRTPLPIVPKAFMERAMDPKNRFFYKKDDEIDHAQFLEAEGLLIAALKNMKNLKSFIWKREPPYYDCRVNPEDKEDLWGVLKDSCPSLSELIVKYGDYHARPGVALSSKRLPILNSNMWCLPQSLTRFSYHTYSCCLVNKPIPVEAMTSFLRHSPNLEMLSLFFTIYTGNYPIDREDVLTADLNPLFKDIFWPRLRALHLGSVHVSPSTASLFFKRHPHLEVLIIVEIWGEARFIQNEDGSPIFKSLEPLFEVVEGGLRNCAEIYVPRRVFSTLFPERGRPSADEVPYHDLDDDIYFPRQ